MIVDTFSFHGEMYVVVESGTIFHINTHGSIYPYEWSFERVMDLA